MTVEARQRKCCPFCNLTNIGKNRKHGAYKCKNCGAIFSAPAIKEITTHGKIPACLREIIEKKHKEAVTGDNP
jgi:ribosomal protein L37AE/L43A